MKKFKSVLALTASVLALSAFAAPVSAFAEDNTVITKPNTTGTQTATHNEQATYTVTIPATVEINTDSGENYTGTANISATGKIAASETLKVTASSDKTLSCGDVNASYDAKVGDTSIFEQDAVVLSGSGALNESATVNYSAAKAGFTVAGDYTDTITFTIAVS